MYLFLDTSHHPVWGLLGDDFQWIAYHDFLEKRQSHQLHQHIHQMLEKEGIRFFDLQGAFVGVGPGSYTGIRLSDGFAQVLEWQSVKVSSFYQFDVPALMGVKAGLFWSEAFKNEIFTHRWEEGGQYQQNRYPKEAFEQHLEQFKKDDLPLFSHYQQQDHPLLGESPKLTSTLIREQSTEFFPRLKELKMRKPPFYFRIAEEEFHLPSRDR